MKETFFHLSEEKQQRILSASLEEFSISGYEKTSLDNIVRKAGISKGGLYEYIESKEDLFQYSLEYAYGRMGDFIRAHAAPLPMPADPLDRTRLISSVAVEFYIAEPRVISFIVRSSQVEQADIRRRVENALAEYFNALYETTEIPSSRYDIEPVISLLKWLLVKTRNDFCENMRSTGRSGLCRDAYLGEWDFFLSVLAGGIYESGKKE